MVPRKADNEQLKIFFILKLHFLNNKIVCNISHHYSDQRKTALINQCYLSYVNHTYRNMVLYSFMYYIYTTDLFKVIYIHFY